MRHKVILAFWQDTRWYLSALQMWLNCTNKTLLVSYLSLIIALSTHHFHSIVCHSVSEIMEYLETFRSQLQVPHFYNLITKTICSCLTWGCWHWSPHSDHLSLYLWPLELTQMSSLELTPLADTELTALCWLRENYTSTATRGPELTPLLRQSLSEPEPEPISGDWRQTGGKWQPIGG